MHPFCLVNVLMNDLPNEMLVKCLGYLPCADLGRFSRLNHKYGYLIDSHRNNLPKPYVHITLDPLNTQLLTIQRTDGKTLKNRRHAIIHNSKGTFEIGDDSDQHCFVPLLGFASNSRIIGPWVRKCFPGASSNIEEAISWLMTTVNVSTIDFEKLDTRWMFIHTIMFKAAVEAKCDLQRVKLLISLTNENRGPLDQFVKSIYEIIATYPRRRLNAQLLVHSKTYDDLFRSRSIVGKLVTFGYAYKDVVFCSNSRWIYTAIYRVLVQWLGGNDRIDFCFRWRFSFPREKHCRISKSYIKKYQILRVSLFQMEHDDYHQKLKKFEQLPNNVDFIRHSDSKTLRFHFTKEDGFAYVSMSIQPPQSAV